MKHIYNVFFITTLLLIVTSCSDFLDVTPKGVLSDNNLTEPENIEGLVVSSYSSLGSDHYTAPYSLWSYGNVRSDDAYKGGRDESDIQSVHFFETFVYVQPNMAGLEGGGDPDELWFSYYVAISRINTAIRALNDISEEEMATKYIRLAEMKFLRAHFYFQLKIIWKYIPFIDETVDLNDYALISNVALSNFDLWGKIVEDFQYAVDYLPESQGEVGRPNKYAAKAYLAKSCLYQAYEQDEMHNVIGIVEDKLEEVVRLCDEVLSGPYTLQPDFGYNFMPGIYENGVEALWSVQYSIGDVTPKGRLNWGDVLSAPMAGGFGCCGFHQPSQNLVNAYKTDASGLPMLDDFNDATISDYNGAQTFDPRLDHTVAMTGKPWKYDPTLVMDDSWIRNKDVYGTYMSLKENVSPDCDCLVNIDPFYGNSKDRVILRLSDVLLMKAEALIELDGRYTEALPLINEVRSRANRSTSFLVQENGSPISNYYVGEYTTFSSKEEAQKALRFERRLEFAMEGSRFFDLVRWGISDLVLNTYFDGEKSKRAYLEDAHFEKNRDEYCPIPLQQINWSKGLYEQNNNY